VWITLEVTNTKTAQSQLGITFLASEFFYSKSNSAVRSTSSEGQAGKVFKKREKLSGLELTFPGVRG